MGHNSRRRALVAVDRRLSIFRLIAIARGPMSNRCCAVAGPASVLSRATGSLSQRIGNSFMSAFDARTHLATQFLGSVPSLLFVESVSRNALTGRD